jgi:hypothetical protein
VEGSGTYLHVIGLLDDAAQSGPVIVQFENDILKIHAYSLSERAERPRLAVYPVCKRYDQLTPGYNCYLDFCPADLHYIFLVKNKT